MRYKRLFYNWLKKENIYNQFFSNVVTDSHILYKSNSGKEMFKYIVNILGKDPRSYISVFIWDDTEQGYPFWSMKSFKWNIYLDQWRRAH